MARANAEVIEDRSSLLPPGEFPGPGMAIAGLAKGMKGIGPGPIGPIGPIGPMGPMGPIGPIGAISGPMGPISMGPLLGPDHGIGHGGGGGIWLLAAGSCDLDSGSVNMPRVWSWIIQ